MKLESIEDVCNVVLAYEAQGLRCHWSGLCVWIESNPNDKQREDLQLFGARYSTKRQQWYFRAVDELPKNINFDEAKERMVA